MTRKDYILIAEALRNTEHECVTCGMDRDSNLHMPASECKPCHAPNEHHSFVAKDKSETLAIADVLATDNPRFDREHFLAVVRGEKDLNSRPSRKAVL